MFALLHVGALTSVAAQDASPKPKPEMATSAAQSGSKGKSPTGLPDYRSVTPSHCYARIDAIDRTLDRLIKTADLEAPNLLNERRRSLGVAVSPRAEHADAVIATDRCVRSGPTGHR